MMDKTAMLKALAVEAVAAVLIGATAWGISNGFADLLTKVVGVLLAVCMFLLLTYGIYTVFEDKSKFNDKYGSSRGVD